MVFESRLIDFHEKFNADILLMFVSSCKDCKTISAQCEKKYELNMSRQHISELTCSVGKVLMNFICLYISIQWYSQAYSDTAS